MTSKAYIIDLHSKHNPKSLRIFLKGKEPTKAQVGYRRGFEERVKGNFV